MHSKARRSRARAGLLFGLLAGVYVSGVFGLWREPDAAAAQSRVIALAQLSLTDSGIVRIERRLSKFDGKTLRRCAPAVLHPAASGPALTASLQLQESSSHRKRPHSLIANSPPSDRASPRPSL